MSIPVHRVADLRSCGAVTVPNPATAATRRVYVNGQLISLTGDLNSHGGGALVGATNRVFVNGVPVVGMGGLNTGGPDPLVSTDPSHAVSLPVTGSPTVWIGEAP